MKKLITVLFSLFAFMTASNAMSYSQAREQALFLTDKMAYELNLTEEQYDAAYEVNLDYLMGVNDYNDLYGAYWTNRNLDLSYILLDWQYRAFCAASYFYRPLYWSAGVWHFAIYSHYPRRNFFYFSRPAVYVSYRGGHSWHRNGGRSWYRNRTFNHSRGNGMRDRFDRGDFRRGDNGRPGNIRDKGYVGNRRPGNNRNGGAAGNRRPDRFNNGRDQASVQNNRDKNRPTRSFGTVRNNRESSTRSTARSERRNDGVRPSNRFSSPSSASRRSNTPSRTFTPRSSSKSTPSVSRSASSSRSSGGDRGGNRGGGHFGGRR